MRKRFLKEDEIKLYKKLLKQDYTLPGLLPMGNGLAEGTWEDVIVFHVKTYERWAFPVIESVTHEVCERATSLDYNMRWAGLTDKMQHPNEFTDEMMETKRKYWPKWKKNGGKFKTIPAENNCSRMIFSGLNPNKLVKAHPIERKVFKTGVQIYPAKIENGKRFLGQIIFTFNIETLTLQNICPFLPFIYDVCIREGNSKVKKFIKIPKDAEIEPFLKGKCQINENSFVLNDRDCLKIYKQIKKKSNTMSNALFI